MDLEKLKTFLAVYRLGAMSRAANMLALTQPAVSQQIQSLESYLGHSLFKRTSKGIVALPTADDLAASTAIHVDALQQAIDDRRGISQVLSGLVHIGAPTEFFSHYFTLCKALTDAGLRLNVRLSGKKTIYALLENDEVDIAITASKPENPELDSFYLGDERLTLVSTPSLKRQLGTKLVDLTLLKALPFAAYDPELPLIKQYFYDMNVSQALEAPLITCGDLRTVAALCLKLDVWSVLPEYIVRDALVNGTLERLSSKVVSNGFFLVWKRKSLRVTRIAFTQRVLKQELSQAIAGTVMFTE